MSSPSPPHKPGGSHRRRPVEVRRGAEGRLVVRFHYDRELIARIREIPGRRWNVAEQHWTIPAQAAALALLVSRFQAEDLVLEESVVRLIPKCGLEGASWRHLDEAADALGEAGAGAPGRTHGDRSGEALGDTKRTLLKRVHDELTIRGYSPRTRKGYVNHARLFLEFAETEPSQLRASQIREHVRVLLEDRGLSHSYADQSVSAIKFLFKYVLRRPLEDFDFPRPKRQRKLPSVLSRQEVLSLFGAVENRKHRAILMLVYAAGLRVGEVVRLKIVDVDSDRGLLHIRQGKGRKDRYVPLSRVALHALRTYVRYDPTPGPWLFPGREPGRHLGERSVQYVFTRARERAGIKKPASVHTLRHSYATHLHEGGVGLRYIQSLLGHKSPKTTEIYTHVSTADLGSIQSPLDQIMGPDAITEE